jgi:hypothetical protein
LRALLPLLQVWRSGSLPLVRSLGLKSISPPGVLFTGEKNVKKIALGLLLVAGAANGQDLGIKPGLWETKLVHNVVDGKDTAPEMNAKMQAAMANMTPEQRAQMAAMMKGMAGSNGGMRTCISAAMAAKQSAMVDPEGRCSALSATPSGNKISFSFNCSQNGHTSSGTGVRTVNGNIVTTHMDMTTTGSSGQHKVQMDTEMTYLGADCQGVTPADEIMKSMQGQHP